MCHRINSCMPFSKSQTDSLCSVHVGTTKKQNLGSNTWTGSMSREGWKKRRLSSDECEDTNLEDMNMLKSQLQAQNTSCKLVREQRTDHNDSLVSALNKLTDALVKIADNGSKQRDVYEASYIVNEHYDISLDFAPVSSS